MTDNEKNDIRELINKSRDLCYKLAKVENKLQVKHGIGICAIEPDGRDVRVNVRCGIEKILEATGCTGTVEDFLDGKDWMHTLYSGDTTIFQISNKDRTFSKAKEVGDESK